MKTFTLPSLRQKSQAFSHYTLNKKVYYFKFMRVDYMFLADIYLPQENGNLYVIRGHQIIPDVDLISRVKNSDLITGRLFIRNKFGKDIFPDLYNFDTDFELVYYDDSDE